MTGTILVGSVVNSGVWRLSGDGHLGNMRYLVRARVKSGCQRALVEAIERGTLGAGSIAGDEYLRNMSEARVCRVGEGAGRTRPAQMPRGEWREGLGLRRLRLHRGAGRRIEEYGQAIS